VLESLVEEEINAVLEVLLPIIYFKHVVDKKKGHNL
jgi:hypothetical protein